MRKMKWFALVGLAAGAFALVMSTVSCDELTEVCGPCGTIESGDTTISGDARLDGFFKAVSNLDVSTGSIRAGFRANVEEMAVAFGVEGDIKAMALADLVAALEASIDAEFDAKLEAGISVKYQEPRCSANVAVSVEAQAQCEVKAGCDVTVDPGELSVTCEGQCTGGCSGSCTGTCAVEGSVVCSGECRGACELNADVECAGTCYGDCDAECSLVDANGKCKGECSGVCDGTCELEAGASCDGTCNGECVGTIDGNCEGKCEGSCDLECSGGCEGTTTPPTFDAECEASADCQASASAQASATLECSPPSLEIDWEFKGTASASAQAEFVARIQAYKVGMIAVVKGMFEATALITGDADAGIEAPVITLGKSIADLAVNIDDFDLTVGLVPCTIDAFADAGEALLDIEANMQATIEGQATLFSTLDI